MARIVEAVGGEAPTNGAEYIIEASRPYTSEIRVHGTADLLFHRWNCESVDAKAKAAKGSKAKKSDDVESYVYRDDKGFICFAGEYLRGAVVGAAKFRQDPRSPRKSAQDLYKAGIISLTTLTPVLVEGVPSKEWDYLHMCRATVQRNGVTRTRPAFKAGWEAEFLLMVNLPEYIPPQQLHSVLVDAGRLIGMADFRPTYGRFSVVSFTVLKD